MVAIVLAALRIPAVQVAIGLSSLLWAAVSGAVAVKVVKSVDPGTPGALPNPFEPDVTPIIIGVVIGGILIFLLAGRR